GRVGDFEGDGPPLEDPEALPGELAAVGRDQGEVEDRPVADRGEPADRGERQPADVARAEREPRAEDPAEPPGGHLPRRPRSLPEPEVGDQRGERADREARRRAERVPGEDDDVGGRLDVGEGGEGDPPGDRQCRQRGDQGDDLGGRARALIPGEAADQDGGEDQETDQLPAHPPAPRASELFRHIWRLKSEARPPRRAAPGSWVTTPGTSRTRATSVAKYQPPERMSALGPSAITIPSPRRTTRSANSAANSTSWVAIKIAAPCAARRSTSAWRSSLRPRSMPRVGSSRATRPGTPSPSRRPARVIARARRWRSPPERSRGSASIACSMPTARSAARPASPGSSSPTRSRTR